MISQILKSGKVGNKVTLQGWVRTRRDSKEFSFLEINDGSCMKNIQVVAGIELENYEEQIVKLGTGSSVKIEGELVQSPGKEQAVEVKANSIVVLGFAPEDYPLQKKRHTNEFLRTIAHLRPRTNTFGAVFRVRNRASWAVHKFFQERGFLYLQAPIITTSDCEGAGQMFAVTTLPLNKIPKTDKGEVEFKDDFFGKQASLTVSGQLEGEIFATAFSNIYTFGPTFRAENSNTPRHLAEFWMIEPEMAFYDLKMNADLAEQFIKYVIKDVLDNCTEDMEFFDKWIEPGILSSLAAVAEAEFGRVTYTEAIKILEAAISKGEKFEYPVSWGIDLQTEHERFLSEKHFKKPVFVTNYPREIKAFYMRLDPDEKTVSAMDLLAPRIGEIIGGSQREEREDILRTRMIESHLNPEDYWWYLELRKFGTVPHAGFGLGFERLVMYLTGMQNVRDVIPFPRTPGSAEF